MTPPPDLPSPQYARIKWEKRFNRACFTSATDQRGNEFVHTNCMGTVSFDNPDDVLRYVGFMRRATDSLERQVEDYRLIRAGFELNPLAARCDAQAHRGTGYGVCDAPLDVRGNCARVSDHVDSAVTP